MRILIINHYAGSPSLGMAYRPYYLAKEFTKMGHKVTIIGASYSHLRIHQPVVKNDLHEDTIEGVSYIWLKTPSYRTNISRIFNMLVFIFKLYLNGDKISGMTCPDVVIASSTYPMDIFPSKKIASISKAKLCFEVHDLWPLSPMIIGGYSKYHPYISIVQWAENYAYRFSDIVVSMLGNAKEYMVKHGLDPEKFVHVPNGFDRDEFESMQEEVPADHLQIISKLKNEDRLIIGYTGGHGPSNAMHTFVETAELFIDNEKVFFISVGNGILKSDLQLKAAHLKNIMFLPPVPKKSIQRLLSLLDILYVGFVKSEIHKYGISPNKLIDYMLASKPIILSADVENEIVDRLNCGITVPAEDSISVFNAMNELLNLSESERLAMGLRGKEFTFRELEYSKLAERFIDSIPSTYK